MSKWKRAFERTPPGHWESLDKVEYIFGPPATEAQIDESERALGMRFSLELRELLAEFNGIWTTTELSRNRGYKPEMVYLDLENITVGVPTYFRTCENELPPDEELQKFVFFCQSNGFAALWGICMSDLPGVRAGEIASIDEECVWKKW